MIATIFPQLHDNPMSVIFMNAGLEFPMGQS